MQKRIEKIQERMREENLDAFLVTNPSNIFYLTGFRGILKEREFLLLISKNSFEIIVPFLGLVEELRKIKDKEEINLIKKATEIGDKTFYSILKIITPGLTEKFTQRKIIEIMEDFGAEGPAFLPIVASGKESAEPHHSALNKKIKRGEILLLDFGAKYGGYCSDLSRTIFIGKAPPRFKKIYNIILETQEMAIKKCQSGYPIKNLYQDGVSNFRKYKEEKNFFHNLGHGVGIDEHEFPGIGPGTEGGFETGMIITIEPGLYQRI